MTVENDTIMASTLTDSNNNDDYDNVAEGEFFVSLSDGCQINLLSKAGALEFMQHYYSVESSGSDRCRALLSNHLNAIQQARCRYELLLVLSSSSPQNSSDFQARLSQLQQRIIQHYRVLGRLLAESTLSHRARDSFAEFDMFLFPLLVHHIQSVLTDLTSCSSSSGSSNTSSPSGWTGTLLRSKAHNQALWTCLVVPLSSHAAFGQHWFGSIIFRKGQPHGWTTIWVRLLLQASGTATAPRDEIVMVVVRMLHAVLLWLQQRQHVGSSNDDNDPKKMLSSRRDVFLEQLVSSGLWSQLQPALWVVVPSPDPLHAEFLELLLVECQRNLGSSSSSSSLEVDALYKTLQEKMNHHVVVGRRSHVHPEPSTLDDAAGQHVGPHCQQPPARRREEEEQSLMVGSSGSPPTYDCHWEHQQQQQQQQHTRNYYHHHRDEIQALVQAHYRTIATALCTQMSTTPHGRHNNHDLVVLDLEFATTTTTTTTSGAQQEQEVAFGIASVEDYDRHVAWRLRQCSPQKLKTVVRRDGQVEVYALEFGGGACHHAAKDDNDNAVVPALVEPPPLENVAAIPDDTTTTTTTTSTSAMVVPDSHQSPQLANTGDDLVMYRPLFPNGALWLSLFVAVLAVWCAVKM